MWNYYFLIPTFELFENNLSAYLFLRYLDLFSIAGQVKSQLLSYLLTLDTDSLKRPIFVAKPSRAELRKGENILILETEKCNSLCDSWNLSNNGYGEFSVTTMLDFGTFLELLEYTCGLLMLEFHTIETFRELPGNPSPTSHPEKPAFLKAVLEAGVLGFQYTSRTLEGMILAFIHSFNKH